MYRSLVHGILENDHGSISKAVTLIENGGAETGPLLNDIYKSTKISIVERPVERL